MLICVCVLAKLIGLIERFFFWLFFFFKLMVVFESIELPQSSLNSVANVITIRASVGQFEDS